MNSQLQPSIVTAVESDWLLSLPSNRRVLFLAALGHALTIAARDTYVPQTEEVLRPQQLRRINEVQHRVLACQYEILTGKASESFQRSIAQLIFEQPEREFHDLVRWAWQHAKNREASAIWLLGCVPRGSTRPESNRR